MGRAERRAKEKRERQESKKQELALKARANMTKLRNDEVDRIQDVLTDVNLTAIFNAFAVCLAKRYNISDPKQILQDLTWIDDLVEKIGTEEFPTLKDFKLWCAKESGVAIGLNEAQIQQVEMSDDNYKFILMINDDGDVFPQKVIILNEEDEYILVNCIGGSENGRVLNLAKDTVFYNNRKEAEHTSKEYRKDKS